MSAVHRADGDGDRWQGYGFIRKGRVLRPQTKEDAMSTMSVGRENGASIDLDTDQVNADVLTFIRS